MILYPTETLYGIGVNPFDKEALDLLFAIKGRDERKVSAWLVRKLEDIEQFAELSGTARVVAEQFLPGQLTLVLPAKDTVPSALQSDAGTIGLRISADPIAQQLITEHFAELNAPLTCTSANVSGLATQKTPTEIIAQFEKYSEQFTGFTRVIDDGPRSGLSSTVVSVVGDTVEVLREGAISRETILSFVT
jgi:L-threonylcarbamoyladenylate synthase